MRTFHLSGNVDHRNSLSARAMLLNELRPRTALAIDLTGVTHIDSAGLAVLVQVYCAARKNGCDVHLVNVSHGIRKMIRLAQLEGVFYLQENLEKPTIH